MNNTHRNHVAYRDDLRAALANHGIPVDLTPAQLHERLRGLLGNERYETLCDLLALVHTGEGTMRDVYPLFDTAEEANAFISSQARAMVEIGAIVYGRLLPHLAPGSRTADLGCFTGGHIAWLAQRHPESQFVGFDRNAKGLEFARQLSSAPNVQFIEWDYEIGAAPAGPPFDALFTIFGLGLNSLGQDLQSLDLHRLGDCQFFASRNRRAAACFGSWRQVAKPGATLFAVLRIDCVDACLAVAAAAAAAGWTLDLTRSRPITVDDERVILLTFTFAGAQPINEEQIIDWYATQVEGACDSFKDAAAIKGYRALTDRQVTQSRDFHFSDGHTMRIEIGTAGDRTYILSRSTRGFTQFQLITPAQAEAIGLDTYRPEDLPITFQCPWRDTDSLGSPKRRHPAHNSVGVTDHRRPAGLLKQLGCQNGTASSKPLNRLVRTSSNFVLRPGAMTARIARWRWKHEERTDNHRSGPGNRQGRPRAFQGSLRCFAEGLSKGSVG